MSVKYVEAMIGRGHQLVTVSSPDWETIADQLERLGLVRSDEVAIVRLSDLKALIEKAEAKHG